MALAGALTLISSALDGTPGNNGGASGAVFSPDWTRVVAFESQATNLVPGDTSTNADVFVKTLATNQIQRISTALDCSQANGPSHRPLFSPDGTKVAFESEATNLVAGDTNGATDIFIKTMGTGVKQPEQTEGERCCGSQVCVRAVAPLEICCSPASNGSRLSSLGSACVLRITG